MSFIPSSVQVSPTFNGNYHDVQGNQDNRHNKNFGAVTSTFTTIGGDQIDSRSYTHQGPIIIQLQPGPSGTSLPGVLQTVMNRSTLMDGSDGLPIQTRSCHQQAMVASDSAFALILSIVQLLRVNRTDSSDKAIRNMERSLKLLYDTISTSRVALQLFESTLLGRNLAMTIKPTLLNCCENLKTLLDKLEGYRRGLSYTIVQGLWGLILWSGPEVNELHSVIDKLSANQVTLGEFLAAINSISWTELGNGLCSGTIPFQKFRIFLQHSSLHLQHIPLSRIIVVDHLGSNIPVPTMFCSTWQDFCYIINGYCKGRAGVQFIEQGDFELIRPEDNQTISPSDFASAAQPGMVFEMSIVLRQTLAMFGSYKKQCPRCYHVNHAGSSVNEWIECRRCSGHFQVDFESDKHKFESGSNDLAAIRNEITAGPTSTTVSPSTDNEDLKSPASAVSNRSTLRPSKNEDPDEAYFFRRIRLLCNTLSPTTVNWKIGFTPTPFFVYDMSLPPSCIRLGNSRSSSRSFSRIPEGLLNENATSPPSEELTLIFMIPIPWPKFTVKAKPGCYVTLLDVFDQLYLEMMTSVTAEEYHQEACESEEAIGVAYCYRRDRKDVPVEKEVQILQRVDFLKGKNIFLGLVSTDEGPHVWRLEHRVGDPEATVTGEQYKARAALHRRKWLGIA